MRYLTFFSLIRRINEMLRFHEIFVEKKIAQYSTSPFFVKTRNRQDAESVKSKFIFYLFFVWQTSICFS